MIKNDLPALRTSDESRRALFIATWSLALIWIVAFPTLTWAGVHRQWLVTLVPEAALRIAGAFFISGAIAFIGVHLLDVHEAIYDRLFVRWRSRHESDFILPRLFAPFQEHFSPNYAEVLKTKSATLIRKVFWPFISGPTHPIAPNLIRDFYKALTLYWIAEIVEIAVILWLIATFAYATWGRVTGTVPVDWQALLLYQVAAAGMLGVANNLILIRWFRRRVRERTQAEIDEIHQFYADALRACVMETAEQFGMLASRRPAPEEGFALLNEAPQPSTTGRHGFLASPMASLAPAEYMEDRALMCRAAQTLRTRCSFDSVFYAGEDIPEQARFDDIYLALVKDLREIRRSDIFIFHYPARLASSALFELGYAVALRKRVVLLVRNHLHLPFLLQALAHTDRTQECTYKDQEDLLSILERDQDALFGTPGEPT